MLIISKGICLNRSQAFLSNPPTSTTFADAEAIIDRIDNPQPEKAKLTWKDILAEEPLEGQHWEGAYGLPPGSTVENWDNRSDGSSPSLSPWDSESDGDESRSASRLSHIPETPPTPPADEHGAEVPRLEPPLDPMNAYRHRQDVEELHSRQYWRSDWNLDASISQQFDLGDASSLGKNLPLTYHSWQSWLTCYSTVFPSHTGITSRAEYLWAKRGGSFPIIEHGYMLTSRIELST